jgi:hypothetical protein
MRLALNFFTCSPATEQQAVLEESSDQETVEEKSSNIMTLGYASLEINNPPSWLPIVISLPKRRLPCISIQYLPNPIQTLP